MTDFTLGNNVSKIEEDGNSSRSPNPVQFVTEKYSTSKINENNNNYNRQRSLSQDFNSNNLNNSVLEFTNSFSTESPESKVKKNENQMLEIKNLTLSTTSHNINTTTGLNVKKKERRFGNTFPFLFYKGEPVIVIGPYCNYYILLLDFFPFFK